MAERLKIGQKVRFTVDGKTLEGTVGARDLFEETPRVRVDHALNADGKAGAHETWIAEVDAEIVTAG